MIAKDIILCGRKYLISPDGTVRNRHGHVLSKHKDVYGYEYVLIFNKNRKRKKFLVHRLVATVYIPNEKALPQINHKDGVKTNNRVENLEWVTNSQNQMHSRYSLGNVTGFPDTPVKCVETGIIYKSTRDAWRETGTGYSHISECARGKRKTAGGLHWEEA